MAQNKNTIKGISTPKFVAPISIILAILHTLIIFSIIRINIASGKLSSVMSSYAQYIDDAVDMQAGSSYLSETSLSFLLHPVIEQEGKSSLNIGPIVSYATEYVNDRRGEDVYKRFASYNVSDRAKNSVRAAADAAKKMNDIQLHAIELTRSVYPFPPISELDNLPRYTLSQQEIDYSGEEKLAEAFNIITGIEYSYAKKTVSENIAACTNALREEMQGKSRAQAAVVTQARIFLWICTLTVVTVLLFIFVFVIKQLIVPINGFVRGIDTGSIIEEKKGLHEVRVLAHSYNKLLKKKNKLEDFLRNAAETDTLTDLPNRYYFEQYLTSSDEAGYSVALLLFDVNYLKRTNDTEGHLSGDRLLKRAADTIKACFGVLPDSKCFRYGGDEFAAIVKNCSLETILNILPRFEKKQEENNVSIAIGYAYTEDIKDTTYQDLFLQADKEIYAQKRITHNNNNAKGNSEP